MIRKRRYRSVQKLFAEKLGTLYRRHAFSLLSVLFRVTKITAIHTHNRCAFVLNTNPLSTFVATTGFCNCQIRDSIAFVVGGKRIGYRVTIYVSSVEHRRLQLRTTFVLFMSLIDSNETNSFRKTRTYFTRTRLGRRKLCFRSASAR